MDWGKAFSISTVQSVKRVCECSKGYNKICKAIWTSWKFSTGSGSGEIGMYFLILLHKLVVHVSYFKENDSKEIICLDNFMETCLKMFTSLTI